MSTTQMTYKYYWHIKRSNKPDRTLERKLVRYIRLGPKSEKYRGEEYRNGKWIFFAKHRLKKLNPILLPLSKEEAELHTIYE